MKCKKCGFFGSTIGGNCPYCESSELENIQCSWISMWGYEFCITKEKICISKIGHSDIEDGFITMATHAFEKMVTFYSENKGRI